MLRANGSLLAAYPFRHTGGAISSNKWQWGRASQRCRFDANGIANNAATAAGTLHPGTWCMPLKPGSISCFTSANITFVSSNPALAGGVNLEGTGTISFTVPDAQLQLIANLSGTSSIVFSVPTAALGGAANIAGTSSINFTVPAALLGGTANLTGTATITFGSTANMMALAFISGPAAEAGLTADAIATAVYNKLLAEDITGQFWAEQLEAGFSADRILRVIAAAVAGKTSTGPTGFTARGLSDAANMVVGTADESGNRDTAVYGA